MRSVLAVCLLSLLVAGCSGLVHVDKLRYWTAQKLNLTESDCPKIKQNRLNDGHGNFAWLAVCKGRQYQCSQTCSGVPGCLRKCDETAGSQAETTHKVVIDRLSIETGCPPEKIEIISQAEWKSGTETAYRMKACNKTYVCTAAAGRTECKAALAQEEPEGGAKTAPDASPGEESRPKPAPSPAEGQGKPAEGAHE